MKPRIQALDALRGLVMIVMALDHVRDYFHAGAMSFNPEDLTRTTPALFFTRWVTHICAPMFAFLAGAGAFLWLERHGNIGQLSSYLWKRGLWLIVLDLTVLRFAMFFSLTNGPVLLSVLWSLGWSMVMLAFLIRLPERALWAVSLGVILLHNLTDGVQAASFGAFAWVWNILHQPGPILAGSFVIFPAYTLVPWFAAMSAGFCVARWLIPASPEERRRRLLQTGFALTAAFLVLRWVNVYGDPQPWQAQSSPLYTVLSFLRTTKYPPSLQFLCMTIGPGLLLWAWLERKQFGSNHPLLVFGRAPLFFFLAHFFLIHALVYVFAWMRYDTIDFLRNPLPSVGGPAALYPDDFGYSLPVVYAVWALVVVLMYPVCRAFRARRRVPILEA